MYFADMAVFQKSLSFLLSLLLRSFMLSPEKCLADLFGIYSPTHFVDEPFRPSPANLRQSSFTKGFGHSLQDDYRTFLEYAKMAHQRSA